jgi:hypothetical protein
MLIIFTVVSDCFDRAAGQGLFTRGALFVVLGLFEHEGIVLFITPREVVGRSVTADVTIDASGVNVKIARHILFDPLVSIGQRRQAPSGPAAPLGLNLRNTAEVSSPWP